MTLSTIYQRHAQRRDTEANWLSVNPVLASGELGVVTDAGNPEPFKIGDGVTAFASLPYFTPPSVTAATGADTITATFDPKPVLYDGLTLALRAAAANTGAATFNPNALGAAAITKQGGTALSAGDIAAAGHELLLRYRSSVPRWELLNPAGGAAGNAASVSITDAGGYFTGTDVEAALQELAADLAAAGAGAGTQIGYAVHEIDTAASGTTLIPFDNTIPQITEGIATGLSLAYTPQDATSLLEIEATVPYCSHSVAGTTMAFALFDGGTDAIWSGLTNTPLSAGGIQQPPAIRRVIVAGSTSPRTYTVRFGTSVAGTSYVNSASGTNFFGVTDKMTLTVKEIKQ